MKATELLEQQHEEVKDLFERLEKGDGGADQKEIFEELAANLVAHDAIERHIFYPACEQSEWFLTDLLGEARYLREGDSLLRPGLYLDMPGHSCHLFEITPG